MTLRYPNRLLLFGVFALAANGCIALLLRHDHRPIITAAACVDFIVSLPALYYFLVIRAGVQPLLTIVPVLAAGLFRVASIAPLGTISKIVVAGTCECAVGWFLFRQGRNSLAARILWSELSVLRYALVWGMQPDIPVGARAFSMHRAGGVSSMFFLFAGISVMEAGLAHFIVQRWSVRAAWLIFGLSIYGALLLIALARSFTLRPIIVTAQSVLIRSGLIWSVDISRDNIARVSPSGSDGVDCLRVTGMSEPNVLVELHQSVIAEGLYGRRKSIRRIGISADQPSELIQAIRSLTNRD